MARIEPISEAPPGADELRTAIDRIVESRGEVSRPFQLLLHAPALAESVAALGHVVRRGTTLAPADRELVILAAGHWLGCRFVWDSHLAAASAAGVPDTTVAAIGSDHSELGDREVTLLGFVEKLCSTRSVTEPTFEAARQLLGDRGVVELATTVGYYTMLAALMGAADAC
jgi:4-carboxymuconolactone decarboxylase